MIYKNEIANLALGFLGNTLRVSDFDNETGTVAETLRLHFPIALKETLQKHPWTFATGYKTLTLLANENVEGGWGFKYVKPDEALVIRQLDTEGNLVRDEAIYDKDLNRFLEVQDGSGYYILCDVEDAEIEYTKNLSEDSVFTTPFGKAVAAILAMQMAPSLISGTFAKVQNVLEGNISRELSKAIANDLGRTPRRKDPDSPFVKCR